ncbi:MAG TPA: peptidase M64, partial [Desulfobulbaceae bacterium]|nr:peptidase M64 [Desulfobulbaceae bacterium]
MKIFVFLLIPAALLFAIDHDAFFTGKTMRVDYYHSGKAGEEHFSLDQIYETGTWAGSKKHLITPLNLGEYQVRLYDSASGELIYSRGYSTMF